MSTKRRWFGKKAQSTGSVSTRGNIALSSIFQTIQKLPLHRFIDCLVDGNLHSLIISGRPTEEQLSSAWSNILSEYSEKVSTNEYRMYVTMFRELSVLRLQYQQVLTTIDLLRNIRSEYLCKQLNKALGSSFKFDFSDPVKYQDELDRCMNRSKGIKINLDLKEMKFEEIKKKFEGNNVAPTREYFVSVLISLSDHAGYPVTDQITVMEYCERLKRFNKAAEQPQTLKK